MPTVTCENDECGAEIEVDLSKLDIEDSELSGNHTTQYSASGEVECKICSTVTEFSCIWDELNDTGEILNFEQT
jgi:hypothetical protein